MKKTIFRNILKVLAIGGTGAGMSAAAIGLAGMAVWIYCTIPSVCGYAAVALFALATLTAAVSLAIVYLCGCWALHKGKFAA
jgi:hypothetical protein